MTKDFSPSSIQVWYGKVQKFPVKGCVNPPMEYSIVKFNLYSIPTAIFHILFEFVRNEYHMCTCTSGTCTYGTHWKISRETNFSKKKLKDITT